MANRRVALSVFAVAISLVLSAFVFAPAAGAGSKGNGVARQVARAGTTHFSPTQAGGSGVQNPQIGPGLSDAAGAGGSHGPRVNRSRSIEHGAPSVNTAPVAAGVGVSS